MTLGRDIPPPAGQERLPAVKALLITGGSLYLPAPAGVKDLLVLGDRVARLGPVDRRAAEALLGSALEVVDASGCLVTPGFIDPHAHIDGGSGEEGYASRSPALRVEDLAAAGITTVVGTIGTDVTAKTMASLLVRARGLAVQGLTAYCWTGGYTVPPATLTGSVRQDMLFVPEILGAGEIAVSDHRSTAPTTQELARLVLDAHVGGILTGRAGLTHFHVGEAPGRLAPLRALLEGPEWGIQPRWLYPTHVERTKELVQEAAGLAKLGSFVDMDMVERDLLKWLPVFTNAAGDLSRLTLSSDAGLTPPGYLYEQVMLAIRERKLSPDRVLSLVTSNTAAALRLPQKGHLREGCDADLLLIDASSYQLRRVIARGKTLPLG